MAVVLLSINGVGLGHLSRMVEVADGFCRTADKPILFYQGKNFPFRDKTFDRHSIDHLRVASREYLQHITDKINTACRVTEPSVFIEDTHPAPIRLQENIAKFLIIRPTTFAYLLYLKEKFQHYYRAFLIADHPDSPTWPYNAEETEQIVSWKGFVCTGPVYRKPAAGGMASIKRKYGWKAGVPIFVFSMGGGGIQAGADDTGIFLQKAKEVSRGILRKYDNARLLFVKGPLYPPEAPEPEGFELIGVEEDMPALFSIATAAIIRPGFNSIWECIHTQTPFYYIEGTTYSEPIAEKMKNLAGMKLTANERILDPDYRQCFKETSAQITARWPGDANGIIEMVRSKPADPEQLLPSCPQWPVAAGDREAFREKAALLARKRFFIRVDDVVAATDELDFILSLLSGYSLPVSIEVIPYLSTLREADIGRYDPDGNMLSVGQHGFSHVIHSANGPGIRSEFDFSEDDGQTQLTTLLTGKRQLEKTFPHRYKHGFSAPFDSIPGWLPDLLEQNGWKYLILNQAVCHTVMTVIKARVDVWDWKQSRMKSASTLFDAIIRQSHEDGYAGLILHPLHFKCPDNRQMLQFLVAAVARAGFGPFRLP